MVAGRRVCALYPRRRRVQLTITLEDSHGRHQLPHVISLDGFVAGPDQSRENPLGKRGLELHSWHLGDERANEADATAERRLLRPRGAYIMGRNMFGPVRGEWDEEWSGWWGPEPPYHAPVFVLTHHAHAPIEMEGGTTFHFVTDGFDAAYAQARETAGADGIDMRAAPRPSARRCWPESSTSSGSTSPPFCSVRRGDIRRRRRVRFRARRGPPLTTGDPHLLPPGGMIPPNLMPGRNGYSVCSGTSKKSTPERLPAFPGRRSSPGLLCASPPRCRTASRRASRGRAVDQQ